MKINLLVTLFFIHSYCALANGTSLNGLTLSCATCHGLPGEKNNVMNLYGYDKKRFYEKFKSFQVQSGNDRGVMHFIAKGYSDIDIKRMAAHFAEDY